MNENNLPDLKKAELERLAILSEEMGEAQQCIGKILRHGYESYNPLDKSYVSNREGLEIELGHVREAITMLHVARDISDERMVRSQLRKRKLITRWLHHQ